MDAEELQEHWLEAVTFLSGADERLAILVEKHQFNRPEAAPEPSNHASHFVALARTIVGQQLSTAVARTMTRRLFERFDGQIKLTPAAILADEPDALRQAVGLSNAKTRAIFALAQAVEHDGFPIDSLAELSDEQLIETLVQLRGIGEWTAHMFAMSQLQRPDILAPGDLGVRRAIEQTYELEALPSREEVEALGERWRPYRTTACRVLWRSLDNS